MASLVHKRILLGVTGGIAAYKAADLTRRLVETGAEVQVVMTQAAQAFVGPLTFQALSGRAVRTELLDPAAEAGMGHIELARWADAVLIAPCTADFMARLAQGRADDLLTTLCLATEAPIAMAPAMNRVMWANAATQANLATLTERGIRVFGPGAGDQACGETGAGRMLEPLELVDAVAGLFATGALSGRRVLITAGPTREPIDPVRYLTNRSSGRMGFALAEAAAEAGAEVTLVAGPCALATPCGVARVDIETAAEMQAAVLANIAGQHLFIGAAAIADYRPTEAAAQKIKKQQAELNMELEPTTDVLAEVAARADRPFVVGFAAETERLAEHAREKLARKRLDLVFANRVGPGLGFEVEHNAIEAYWVGGERSFPVQSKARLARALVALIAERLDAPARLRVAP